MPASMTAMCPSGLAPDKSISTGLGRLLKICGTKLAFCVQADDFPAKLGKMVGWQLVWTSGKHCAAEPTLAAALCLCTTLWRVFCPGWEQEAAECAPTAWQAVHVMKMLDWTPHPIS